MNYIRGAVNVISAPYQYYKELPPLNPSTLTGAIDVIVVSTPTQDGTDTELVCSPFHVRFGKWQVLRPADKKVTLTVNGRPIPFNMKIGEAGEAFFIFETAGDVPDDLITSPLLTATQSPNLEAQAEDTQTKRLIAIESTLDNLSDSQNGRSHEPDFLDLDASSQQSAADRAGISLTKPAEESHSEVFNPSSLLASTSRQMTETAKAAYNVSHNAYSLDVSEPVLHEEHEDETSEPIYIEGVVIDIEGYHSHGKERSDRTIKSKDGEAMYSSSVENTPGPSRSPSPMPYGPSSSSPTISTSELSFPIIRATSEPPPDVELSSAARTSHVRHESATSDTLRAPMDEYMWEWGAFPQKSPINAVFDAADLPTANKVARKGQVQREPKQSETFPPSSSLPKDSLSRHWEGSIPVGGFGFGGRLRPDREDPCLFTLVIEGKSMPFELSIMPAVQGLTTGSLGGDNEVEDAKIFNDGKIDFWKFIGDEHILHDPNLVLRLCGDRYVTRYDGSPLMTALSTWRDATLQDKDTRSLSRSLSPFCRSDATDGDLGPKPTIVKKISPRASSTSWVRWWSRSRRTSSVEAGLGEQITRLELRGTSSAPPQSFLRSREEPPSMAAKESLQIPRPTSAGSTPPGVYPEARVGDSMLFEDERRNSKKRYAKTLRLTSEQLKLLDLKPGSNTVTFSLSTTGVAACTARIFVWDHTDRIVVSDIDGTITKSDALGHVFTMIGRDWTHLGVAKLYTDIRRNGYKIMYLTSRAIGQADSTRYYLKGIKQNDYQLPEGPVIMSPDRLMASLHREVIMRKPEVFKMACLRDIRRLFGTSVNPFYAGFGNRITDALSYRSVDIPSSRTFTIDFAGEVKMELLELAGYKSSYIHMTDLVDQIFPPIHRQFDSQFTDFNYWKPPMREYELPVLTPPSPALSARSDTSNQSTLARLRNLSLMGGRQPSKPNPYVLPPPSTEGARNDGTDRHDSSLDLQVSLERLGHRVSTFASSSSGAESPTASSSTFVDSGDEGDASEECDIEEKHIKRRIRRGSMPGSLVGSDDESEHGDFEDDEDYGYQDEYDDDAAAEQAFDDDLFATGEMKNVPFL